jgi:RHS repeat-associated protein
MSTIKIAALWWVLSLCAGAAYAGTHHYYYTDAQGTVLAKADASGAIVATYDYAPYGTAVSSMNPAPNGPGYTGHVNDPESGFVYMQARYYDPAVGRFLSVDPASQSSEDTFYINRYAYVSNNPINKVDPTGAFECKDKASCDAGIRLRSDFLRAQGHYKRHSPAYNSLEAGIKALGTANDGGPIHLVTVNQPSQPALGWGSAPKGQTPILTINLAQLEAPTTTQQREANFAATGRHEIQHVMDDMVAGDKPRDPVSEFWHEVRGIRAETPIWEGLNQNDHLWETWTKSSGLNMKNVYREADYSTTTYCPNGKCP